MFTTEFEVKKKFIVFNIPAGEVLQFNNLDDAIEKAKDLKTQVISISTGQELFDFSLKISYKEKRY